MGLRSMLIGKRLETKALAEESVSKVVGLAVFASDGLSSTAYATEEILIILSIAAVGPAMWAGSSGTILGLSLPIAIAISILIAVVGLSYRQTIHAYPNGGGAYIVARDNLGELPAQVAGAALLTDYILTVAVSISSGVAQITSLFHELLPYKVAIAVGVIVIMTIINLRGVKESGQVFAIPTYFFLGAMFLTLGIGIIKFITGTLVPIDPHSVHAIEHFEIAPEAGFGMIFLILRAFSSGCTALTGIEAISNGIQAFKEPKSKNAAVTLVWMCAILMTLFIAITFVVNQIHAIPSHNETVISQLGRAIYGDESVMHFVVLAATALILLMAANTAYAGFPRLAALQAGDGFLPRQLTFRGGRLVFSWGIVFLAVAASILVIIMNASTTALIPLYAVGVFMSFTLSQAGMFKRFLTIGKMKPGEKVKGIETDIEYDPHWRQQAFISGFGTICTFTVMLVFAVTKFTTGAWFIVILIPLLVYIFFRIHTHYKGVAHALSLAGRRPDVDAREVQTLILVDDVHTETAQLVNFAKSLRHPWKAVHIAVNAEKAEIVEKKWDDRIGEGELVIIPSPFRELTEPITNYIEALQAEKPGSFVHVIMGHLAMDSYWEQVLHQNSSYIFTLSLSRLENVVVTTVPFHIHLDGDQPEQPTPEPETVEAPAAQ
jgi:amino acid transporter